MTTSFIKHLELQLRDSPPKQKGLRARERLKIAIAKMLTRDGYHGMRGADISAAAKLAEGSFHVYCSDKTDAALTVLTQPLTDFPALDLEIQSGAAREPFAAIRL